MTRLLSLAAASLVAMSSFAAAHATLEVRKAPAGSTYRAVVRIGHGCDGEATKIVRVRIPEGLFSVKPQLKPGWTIATTKGAYAKTYLNHGSEVKEGVVEIAWTGDLPDEFYDDFVFRGTLDKELAPGTVLWFPVVQECANKAERWIEIPAAGQSPDDLESPAPGLTIEPAASH